MRGWRVVWAGAVATVIAASGAGGASSSTATGAGALDPSFGSGGIVVSEPGTQGLDRVRALVQQPDGKLVVAGELTAAGGAVVRYLPSGAIDTSFGSSGLASPAISQVLSLLLQPDGKLVAVTENQIARLNADGSLDTGFGSNGIVDTARSDTAPGAAGALQGDGAIVVANTGLTSPSASPDEFIVRRFLPNGSPDTSFGTAGVAITPFSMGNMQVDAVTVLASGDILVVGNGAPGGVVLAEYLPNGSLDPSFGSNGLVTGAGGFGPAQNAVTIDGSGRILVAGDPLSPSSQLYVARFLAGGQLDDSFGSNGVVTVTPDAPTFSSATATNAAGGLAIQPDGKIVVAGEQYLGGWAGEELELVRLTDTGAFDSSFGNGGRTLVPVEDADNSMSTPVGGLVLDGSGRPVVAAWGMPGGYYDVVLARFQSDASTLPADTTPPETTITQGPPSVDQNYSARFYFRSSENGSTFSCSVDGGPFRPCISPYDTPSLATGTHSFCVAATDLAGNADATPAAYEWSVVSSSGTPPTCASASADFGITVSPSSLAFQQGIGGTATVSTSGSGQTVNLSVSGEPSGMSASFDSSSVAAGSATVLRVNTSTTTAAGTYTLTITGAGLGATHSATLTVTVTAAPAAVVYNGDFELGGVYGWTASGPAGIVTTAHAGSYAAQVGSTSASATDGTLQQAVTIPAGSSKLSFWYQPHCPDTLTYDQIKMQIRSTSGATLANVLNVCSNSGSWTNVTVDTSSFAGQQVVLWFDDHDDGYYADPTYFLLDDVQVTTSSTTSTSDFSLSASPSSLSVGQGSSATATIATSVTSGSAQSVSLSASGQPSGTTVSFNPASATAGSTSTMTVSVGLSTAPGTYSITVTAKSSPATHTTSVSLTVTQPSDFSLTASPSSLSAAQGSAATSAIATTVTSGSAQSVSLSASGAPSGTTVSFSPASVTAGSSTTMTLSVGSSTAAGSYTITVTGTSASATHTTTVTLTVTAAAPPPPQGLVNGGFETGTFAGWSTSGAFLPRVSATPHSGSHSAQLGSTGAVNGNSTLTQTVTVPAGSPTLRFWYQPHCPDTIQYDQIQMQIRSTSGTRLATVLNACTNSGAWTQVTYGLSAYAGKTVVLWFNDHDDGYAGDPTYYLLDDVSVG